MSLRVVRRDFLKFAGAGALGAATSGITLQGLSRFNEALAAEEIEVPSGPEAWKLSICTLCPSGCGLRVRTIGARAVGIQGNPLHPVNHGGLCPRGVAGLQVLYHPDRLRAPLKSNGGRGSGRWEEISWEQAIEEFASRLRKLRDSGEGHTLALVSRDERSLLSRFLRRFLFAFGSPNYLVMPSGLDAVQAALYFQQGTTHPVAYDLPNTRYLLSFGANLLEGWGSPTAVMRAFGRWRDSSGGRRTKFVQIEPRYSLSAARADEWVSLRPGAEAALALGMAYVLITEELYDAAFVRDHTFGFEDWKDATGQTHIGFRSLVMNEYRLNDVATLTEVPPMTILRLAREFARNRPALAIGDRQTSTLPGNPYAAMAVHSLNALVGSIDAPGGVLIQPAAPLPEAEEHRGQAVRQPRLSDRVERPWPGNDIGALMAAIDSGRPYPVKALILNDVNPVFSLPNGQTLHRNLEKIPFLVSFASFLDETSSLADLILPVPVDLEKWQESSSPPTFPYALQSISAPVVEPRQQQRHIADVLLEVARTLGDPVAGALPYADYEEYLRTCVNDLFAAQTGSVYTTGLEETWNRLLERSGWWAPSYSSADELWEQMQQHGGWWEPTYYHGVSDRVLQTSSGRFEFYSTALAEWMREHPDDVRRMELKPGDDHVCLPRQRTPAQPPENYPLLLLPIEILPLAGGNGGHLPYLQQIAGPHVFAQWDSWLEIHPGTAHKLDIADGDMVWVESPRGRARVRARLYEGTRPDVVHLPLGYGHTEGSAWGKRGVNPLALIEEHYDPLAGLAQTGDTYVKVYRS